MNHQDYANVWDALTDSPEAAANMTMRSNLLIALQQKVKSWKVTQAEAARRLGVTPPQINELLRSKIDKFSLDMLIELTTHAEISILVAGEPHPEFGAD
jgi:predicted XRE-type DNA-binding protein